MDDIRHWGDDVDARRVRSVILSLPKPKHPHVSRNAVSLMLSYYRSLADFPRQAQDSGCKAALKHNGRCVAMHLNGNRLYYRPGESKSTAVESSSTAPSARTDASHSQTRTHIHTRARCHSFLLCLSTYVCTVRNPMYSLDSVSYYMSCS